MNLLSLELLIESFHGRKLTLKGCILEELWHVGAAMDGYNQSGLSNDF